MASRMMRSRSWRKGKHFSLIYNEISEFVRSSEHKNSAHSQQNYLIRNVRRAYIKQN